MGQEPSLKDQLLSEYERLEDAIENVATTQLWALADWLAEYVPNSEPGPKSEDRASGRPISIKDLTGRRGRSERWLKDLRKVARDTQQGYRVPDVTPRVYMEALKNAKGNLSEANMALTVQGKTLRTHSPRMESAKALTDAAAQLPASDRVKMAAELLRGEDVPNALTNDPAEWSDIEGAASRAHSTFEKRATEADAVRKGSTLDERSWASFRRNAQPLWGLAFRSAYFEWTPERVQWLRMKADEVHTEYVELANQIERELAEGTAKEGGGLRPGDQYRVTDENLAKWLGEQS